MTIKEFRETVAESEHSEYLNGLTINIPYSHLAEPIKKTGITDIYRFFKNQHKEWSKIDQNLPGLLKTSSDHFRDCVAKLESFIKSIENNVSRQWGDIHQKIRVHQPNSNVKILTAEAPELDFLLQVHDDFRSSFVGAYDYLILKRVNNAKLNNNPGQSGDYLRGVNLAYEFELQDHTDLLQRRSNEKKSLGHLRSNFEDYISEVELNTTDYLKRTKEKFDTHSDEIVSLKNEKESTFNTWFGDTKEAFSTFDSNSHSKIEKLEKLYTEKLRLDAPVQYWGKRAFWMNIFSGFSVAGLVGVVGVCVYILYSLLTEDLAIYNVKELLGDPGAVKWSIIYITLFSFLAYLVRTLAKVSFSFLHLARDAEERKQLTHVYLALSEESEMSKEDREIVLQSIFSRADTGLLKGDSSPTMPGIILEKFTGRGQ